MDHSLSFTQISSKLQLYTAWEKNKAHIWNKHLLNTQQKNLQVKLTIL